MQTTQERRIMPVLDKIRSAALHLLLGENLSCNEQIIPFVGSVSVETTPKNCKWGYKVLVWSGLSYNFELHAGKEGCMMQNGEPDLGAVSNVVRLCQNIPLAVNDKVLWQFLSSSPLLTFIKEGSTHSCYCAFKLRATLQALTWKGN